MKNDKIVTVKQNWFGPTEKVESINFKNSGLDWNLEKHELFTGRGIRIPDFRALVRADNDYPVHVAKADYGLIQNRQVWDAVENGLNGVNYNVISSGSWGDNKKIFISIELADEQKWVINGDEYKNYLMIISSHAGTNALEAFDTSIRLMCLNKLRASRSNMGKLHLKVRHTKNAEIRLDDFEKSLDIMFQKRREFYASFERLASVPMTTEQAEKILLGFEQPAGKKDMSQKTINKVQSQVQAFSRGIGNHGETAYDLMNGFSEYYTHHCHRTDETKGFISSEFEGGAKKKSLFFDSLLSDEKLNQLAARGEELLEENKLAIV